MRIYLEDSDELSSASRCTDLPCDVIRLSDHPQVVAFSPDGKSLAAHGISSVHFVDMACRAWTKTVQSHEAKALHFHNDNLFVGTKTITVLNAASGRKLVALKSHKAPANALALAGNGQTLFTAGIGATSRLLIVQRP